MKAGLALSNLERAYLVNMPQMAMGGLSELWLFKEVGDLHWALLENGLGCPSSQIQDANGERLYATFTRIKLQSTLRLSEVRENSAVSAKGSITRYGGGLFFSDIVLKIGSEQILVGIASSFTMRSLTTSNSSLSKGQPVILPDCPIKNLKEVPSIAMEHREMKAYAEFSVLQSAEYHILPQHDINGVNLLYFAAYPTINDICEARCTSNAIDWSMNTSTTTRDISYYANCDADDVIMYKLHSVETLGERMILYSTLSRKSDSKLMAAIRTVKVLNGPATNPF
jgi:probable biosynthetic protein (TIGR04098 family)